VKNLCDGFFSTAEVLNTSEGSRLFRSFVYVNPQASVTALITAFLPVPVEVLQSMKEGRRNLVWGLEKLCFRPETFLNATKVLAAFAVAENENIGNNATAQFLQLFHIRLPGTAASLEERWNIIEYCFGKDQNHQSIAVSALSSALSLGHFHRMGGAEDQGDVIPLEDFNPTRSEVYQYWKKVIEKLEMLAINSGPFQERAISILKEKFYGLTTSGAGKLIVPVIKKLIGSGLYDRMEARTRIQSIIKSDRVFDKSSLESLFAMLDELEPTEFSEKFKIWVESPSVDEYMDSDGSRERGKKLAGKVEALADVFFQNQDKWEVWADSFLSNHIAEGLNFGRYIAIKSDKHSAEKLVELLISKLRDAPPEKRNISILLGLTSNFPDKEFARTIFQKVVGDDKLRGISFPLFKSAQLSANEIDLLLGETEKGNFSPGMFSEFQYGWGLKHLSYEDVILIIQRLRKIDNIGKTVAFNVLATWATGDAETFAQYQNLLHEIVLQDSNVILDNVNNSMGSYIYAEVVSKLLTDNHNESLAREILTVIIKQANQFEYYFNKENEFREILSILQERYFPILWDGIRQIYMNLDEYSTVAWHFKSLLGSSHDFLNHSEGLLFGGDPEKFNIIFEWCKLHKGRELYWVAEVLPLFSKERGPDNKWHPYAMKFLDEFGQDKHVLDAIAAKLGTYSWTGSVVPKLESDKALYEQLLNHPEPVVREWATAQLADVVHRIKAERNREEDGIW
jgi:hypothetical protein